MLTFNFLKRVKVAFIQSRKLFFSITRPKKKRIGDDLMASGGKSLKLGHPELTRLWNLNPDNMEACKDESRVFLPKLDDFFANAIDQADPEAMVEEQYK